MNRDIEDAHEVEAANHHKVRRNVIAVIGIDTYASWPALRNAKSDALGVRREFLKLGFSELTSPLLDEAATGDAIRSFVTRDLAPLSSDDNLVLFFAGHGLTHTVVHSNGTRLETGYLVGTNASDQDGILDQHVRLDHWLGDIALLRAHHILVILDSCKSGIALGGYISRTRGTEDIDESSVEVLAGRQSRRIITSALEDQLALDDGPVPNHSLFTGCLLQCLRHGLGGSSPITTGSELALVLQKQVRSYPGSRQTPDFGAFALDDRGEFVLALPQGSISMAVSLPDQPDDAELDDAAGRLLNELARALARIYPDPLAILGMLRAHAPSVRTEDLPAHTPRATWAYILSELSSRTDRTALSAIIGDARGTARDVDWSRFERLVQSPSPELHPRPPGSGTWSHVGIELRWQADSRPAQDQAWVGGQSRILEAFMTLQWSGPRPDEPRLVVSRSRLLSITRSLPYSMKPLASNVGTGVTSWLVTVPISRTLLRTQRITFRCPERDLVEHCYTTPRRGPHLATLLWLLLGMLSFHWLSPIHFTAAMVPGMIGCGTALGTYLSAAGRGSLSRLRWPLGALALWERTVLVVAAAFLAIVLVPKYAVTVLTNTTGKRVTTSDGTVLVDGERRTLLAFDAGDWQLLEPFCICGERADCQCITKVEPVPHVAAHIAVGCLHGDCTRKTTRIDTPGGSATIAHPLEKDLGPITLAPGTATRRMSVEGGDVLVTEVTQRGPLTLRIVPRVGKFTIRFDGIGTLTCNEGARQIVGFESDHHGGTIDVELDKLRSRWRRDHADIPIIYACTNGRSLGTHDLEITSETDGRLECGKISSRASISVRSVKLAPTLERLEVMMDGVKSTWTATPLHGSGGGDAMICATSSSALEIFGLLPGQQVTVPPSIQTVRVRHERRDDIAVVGAPADGPEWIACASKTVRVVKTAFVSAGDARRFGLGPVSAALGVTCEPRRSARDGNRVCTLTRDELRCQKEYMGPCWIDTADRPVPRKPPGGLCATVAPPEETRRARARALHESRTRETVLKCQEVYRCI